MKKYSWENEESGESEAQTIAESWMMSFGAEAGLWFFMFFGGLCVLPCLRKLRLTKNVQCFYSVSKQFMLISKLRRIIM